MAEDRAHLTEDEEAMIERALEAGAGAEQPSAATKRRVIAHVREVCGRFEELKQIFTGDAALEVDGDRITVRPLTTAEITQRDNRIANERLAMQTRMIEARDGAAVGESH